MRKSLAIMLRREQYQVHGDGSVAEAAAISKAEIRPRHRDLMMDSSTDSTSSPDSAYRTRCPVPSCRPLARRRRGRRRWHSAPSTPREAAPDTPLLDRSARWSPRPGVPSRFKVLVVDDEAGMRKSLAIMLRRDGYAVTEAAGGKEAQDQLGARSSTWSSPDLKWRSQRPRGAAHVRQTSPEVESS